MDDPILARIERDAGIPGLVDALAERLAPTDLRSLLLAVARRRAAATTAADVLRRYACDPSVQPASVPATQLAELERLALSLLPDGFERLELSPLCPLGTSSVLGRLSQDWIVTTMRGGEVVSDPTNVLALECALRRRRDRRANVRLYVCQRVVRAQPFEPPFLPHFRLFALVTACRRGAEDDVLAEQLAFYEKLAAAVAPHAARAFDRDPRKQAYYSGATFGVRVGELEVAEGGFVDWTQRLLGDAKERLLISGTGLEMLSRVG